MVLSIVVSPKWASIPQRKGALCTLCKTAKMEKGIKIPVIITVYEDRSFSFITKMPPMAVLIIKELGLAKGSGAPHKDKVGKITQAQCEKIAAQKLPDLNTKDVKQAAEMVKGTCRSMGVDVVK